MKKASKRFVKFTEDEIASFTEDQEDANTKEKTVSDLKLFNEFLNNEEEERNMENIPAGELQQMASKQVSSTPLQPKENVLNAHTKVEETLCNVVGTQKTVTAVPVVPVKLKSTESEVLT